MDPISILKQYFGYQEFRTGQDEVINAILEERDSLAIMPTGAGKSLCFQIPAILLADKNKGITLVISPLISLMQDQVQALIQSGISAAYINSSLSVTQYRKALENAKFGTYQIIYVAPERLEAPGFLEFAQNTDINLLAVDEAHCISHWGQDFRPSYLQISRFIQSLPKRPTLAAFTATATDLVKNDIVKLLGLENPFLLTTGFNRENLYFEVRHPANKFEELKIYLKNHPHKSGIIYCATRKNVDEVTARLNEHDLPAVSYHAGMSQAKRMQAQQDFIHDRVPVIVATNAFGMGIDKSNVSFVIHYNMPKNIESYYQEAGRAGRDGSPADCILFFGKQDIMIIKYFIENSHIESNYTESNYIENSYIENNHLDSSYIDSNHANNNHEGKNPQGNTAETKALDYKRLREMEEYCNTFDCLRKYILDYFNDEAEYQCNNCSNCLSDHKMVDITIEAQKILSCIYRMKGRFGLRMVIEVLRGTISQRIIDAKLDQISTYGIMSNNSQSEIEVIANHLKGLGYIQTVGDRYPVVITGAKAGDILRGNLTIEMPEQAMKAKEPSRTSRTSRTVKSKQPAAKYDINEELFAQLKALRLQIANEENVPAFVIFSDFTLYDMCGKLPIDNLEFLEVSGVGSIKLEKYGKEFLEVIRGFKEGSK